MQHSPCIILLGLMVFSNYTEKVRPHVLESNKVQSAAILSLISHVSLKQINK